MVKIMRIVVNDIAASSGGAKTILNDFYQYIVDSNDQNEWIFLLGNYDLKETEHIKVIKLPEIKQSRIKKLWFDLVTGKKFIEKLSPDIVFSLQNIITFGLKCPQIVYVHQSIPFQKIKKYSFFKKEERIYATYQYLIGGLIKKSIKKANLTIVQTKWMKNSVLQQCKIDDKKVVQIEPNVDSELFKYNRVSAVGNIVEFFYPTSSAVYKNNTLIIQAAEILDKKNLDFSCVLTIDGKCSGSKKVSFVGRLPYEEVIRKYASSCLVFPSYIETFGYPLVEARMAGTLILASDCEFSRELLSNYDNAYFFNPFDAKELAELMQKVIQGKIVRKEIMVKNENKKNSWKYVVDEIAEIGKV